MIYLDVVRHLRRRRLVIGLFLGATVAAFWPGAEIWGLCLNAVAWAMLLVHTGEQLRHAEWYAGRRTDVPRDP